MAILASLLAAGCGGGGGETSTAAQLPAGCSQVQEPAPKDVHLSRPTSTVRGPATATVVTSCGSFTIALDVARAPTTASSFAYTRGIVAMAKTQAEPPGRSGSQFFVVTVPDAGLTPEYALVGRVSSGFDVVQRIEQLRTPSGTPKAPVVIRRVTVQGG